MALSLRDKRVLVTGASSGLGREMARLLAREHHAHPVLVARRKPELESLAHELSLLGTKPEVLVADLSLPDKVESVFSESTASAPLFAAILNAGVTYFGHAREQSPESAAKLVATNVSAVVHLTQRFVPYFCAARAGAILLVSSMASFQPMPYQATYGGTKAFITSYGRALVEELRDEPVSISVFCPGGIATEMIERAGMGTKYGKGHPMVMDAERCAELALEGFVAQKPLVIPGGLNKVAALAAKMAPSQLTARLVARDYRGALPRTS